MGFLLKECLLVTMLAISGRGDVGLRVEAKESFGGIGGDGGGHVSGFPTIPIRVEFKDTQFDESEQGSWLRNRRLTLGISQSELANSVGVHVKSVRAWESGRSIPQCNRRLQLEAILKDSHVSPLGSSQWINGVGPSS